MAAIKFAVDVQISGGPKVNFNEMFNASGYDRLDVLLPGDNTAVPVAIQPGDAEDIRLLIIRSSTPSADVTFDNGGTAVALTSPLVLTGPSITFLDNVEDLTFNNNSGADVTVTILVARSAT